MALGRSRRGNSFPRGVAVPSVFGVLADTAEYDEKSGPLPCSRKHYAGAAAGGPEQHFLYYYTFPFFLIVEFAGGADVNKIMHHPLPAHYTVIGLIAG
jgi:hypothetical protein